MFGCPLLLLTLPLLAVCIDEYVTNADTLIMVQVLMRHGDRAPLKHMTFPNDDAQTILEVQRAYADVEAGELTPEGIRNVYEMGKRFRRRYSQVIGKQLKKSQLYAEAADRNRTIESAQALLASMLAPAPDDEPVGGLRWTPHAVHSDAAWDRMAGFHSACDTAASALAAVNRQMRSDGRMAELVDYLRLHTGVELPADQPAAGVIDVIDTLQNEEAAGVKRPWSRRGPLANYSDYDAVTWGAMSPEAAVPAGAEWQTPYTQWRIVETFRQRLHNRTQHKVVLYALHDYNVVRALAAVGAADTAYVYDAHVHPQKGASLHLELHRTAQGQLVVKAFYSRSDKEEPRELSRLKASCGEPCRFDDFVNLHAMMDEGEARQRCYGRMDNDQCMADAYLHIAALVLLAAMLLMGAAVTCCIVKRQRDTDRHPNEKTPLNVYR